MYESLVYLDNAATTFPKPRVVLERMVVTFLSSGVSPGRGSYDLAAEAEDLVRRTRLKVARFFGAADPDRVIFCQNATDALNLAIQGLVRPGDHVVSSRLEHNSVLRPLHHLRQRGVIDYDLVPFDGRGRLDPDEIAWAIGPRTSLVVLSHASNVLGTIQPLAEIGRVCAGKGVPLVVDAAQSAGVIPVDLTAWRLGAVAFTGHKSLLGPTGIGGLVVGPDLEIQATRYGGTGLESQSLIQPRAYPFRLEAGTLNFLGIVGLSAALDFLEQEGVAVIHRREMALLTRLRDGLAGRPGLDLYCAEDRTDHLALLSANVSGISPGDAGVILDGDFNIAVRVGLHCAPLVHETLGTSPRGAIRFSLGPFNTEADIDRAVEAMAAMARGRGNRKIN